MILKRAQGIALAETATDDQVLLCRELDGMTVVLNTAGACVWELLDGARKSAEIAAEICRATGDELPQHQVEAEVQALLIDLRARRFAVEVT